MVMEAQRIARGRRPFYPEPFEGFTALAALAGLLLGIVLGVAR